MTRSDDGRRSAPPWIDADTEDVLLLRAVAEQRIEALCVLHRRHAFWLRAMLARRCADADIVDEAVQDAFVAVWRQADRYREGNGEVRAWIWTIANRRMISALRGRANRWTRDGPAVEPHHALTASAEDLVLLGVEHGDLGTALGRLSPELRAVLQATVLDGLTVREAAVLLGVPEGTVKTRVMRAKARLREHLT